MNGLLEFIYKDQTPLTDKMEAIEVIHILMHDRRMRMNPFNEIGALPIFEEATKTGGKHKFSTIMGMEAATRRTEAPTTHDGYAYGNNLTTKEVVLTIDEPLEVPGGKLIPTSRADVMQIGGFDFTPTAATKVAKILVDGEIKADVKQITENADVRILTYDSTATDKYTQLRYATHRAIASYYDISEENSAFWANADVLRYFDAGNYSYEPEEIFIYANPSDMSEMSLELLRDGASNGDMVYTEFVEGKVPTINGRPIKASRYVPKGEIWVSPISMIGRPSKEQMYTLIKVSESAKGDLGTYGKHYYDSILVAPELFTRVIPEAVLPTLKKTFKALKKVFNEKAVRKGDVDLNTYEQVQMLKDQLNELQGHLKSAKTEESKARVQSIIDGKQAQLDKLNAANAKKD